MMILDLFMKALNGVSTILQSAHVTDDILSLMEED